jgi:nucleotide-binding universal stress UspA family protein
MPGILVGVDGSHHSRHALAWAMREAVAHHAPLTVMAVRPALIRPATEIFWNIPELPEGGLSEEQARASLQQFVDQVASEVGEKPDEVNLVTVVGDPAEELIQASHDADLLVVGTRGSGGFARLLLGSISSKVMHHSASPTVVIPGRRGSHN